MRFGLLVSTLLVATTLRAEITPEAMESHVDFLADDLLEGREAGTRGYDLAAAYVATRLASAGLAPAGSAGAWYQPVPLRSSRLDPAATTFCIDDGTRCQPFAQGADVLLQPDMFRERTQVDAELAFAGFGVVAPEQGHDDYAGIDVRGKVVVVVSGAPARFPYSERAYHGNNTVKAAAAVAHGAIGLLTVRSLEAEAKYTWQRFAALSSPLAMRSLAGSVPREAFSDLRVVGVLGREAASAVWRGTSPALDAVLESADKGAVERVGLRTRVKAQLTSQIGEVHSSNVVGVLSGGDAKRAREYVVLTAHLDHLGLADTGEDRVRNGAIDNASGIAALIEIARELSARPQRPARSILFVAVTGEEKGLQGSLAFADTPTVPRAALVANVNMDMITMLYPLKNLIALGSEHSTLAPLALSAATAAGFGVVPEADPAEAHFVRSDQFSFVKMGIPALAFRGAPESSDPKIDGPAVLHDWVRNVYHSPKDERSQKIDWPSGVRWAQANLNLALAIANAPARPQWNAGDFFGKLAN